ncbi:MAG: Lrp/AsnC family transcriptional regulator [Bacillota bacterium]
MEELDKKILNKIQEGIPLQKKPFQKMGKELGIDGKKVIKRLKKLKDKDYIRRIGGIMNSSRLGYKSTLVGLRVTDDKFKEITDFINSHPGVTHNYRRDNYLNLWFTLSTRKEQDSNNFLKQIENREGVLELYELPKKKLFKLKVFFEMEDNDEKA